MILPDVNVLVYAFRRDTSDHEAFSSWLASAVGGDEAFAVSDLVLSGFVRVVTHPRVFVRPSTVDEALTFAEELVSFPNCVRVAPGPRHWGVFADLCRKARVKGNAVADAYHAALAIEAGCEWVTADRGFARFPGLRWRHPLDGRQ